jgi:hypothetical protein
MEHDRFDRLTKRVAAGVTRRSIVRTMVGGAAALLGTAIGRESTDAKPKGGPGNECKVGCAGFNRQAKTACEKACKACGGDIDRVCADEGPFGPTAFTCCPTGTFCLFGSGVCCDEGADVCFDPETGEETCCPAGTFCDFETGQCGPPATCDATSGCAGGTCAIGCFCVSSVEGDGACVSGEFANCDAAQCTASDECNGGVCVDATECCGFPTAICFPAEGICQGGGTNGATGRPAAPGWKR